MPGGPSVRKVIRTACVTALVALAAGHAPGQTPSPPVTITLGGRHRHATPQRQGFTDTGGGNIDVAQQALPELRPAVNLGLDAEPAAAARVDHPGHALSRKKTVARDPC